MHADTPAIAVSPSRNPWLAMLASFGRVFLAALGAALVTMWQAEPNQDLTTWTDAKWKAFVAAVLMAALLTTVNAVRRGETRFGVGAQNGDLQQ
jgi:hypothetical protein